MWCSVEHVCKEVKGETFLFVLRAPIGLCKNAYLLLSAVKDEAFHAKGTKRGQACGCELPVYHRVGSTSKL